MCVFSYGDSIQSNEDVRSMVVGLVLRQEAPYTRDDIEGQARRCLDGSAVVVTDGALRALVAESLRVLLDNGNMTCRDGVYEPRNIFAYA